MCRPPSRQLSGHPAGDGYTAYNRLARPDRGNDAITLAGMLVPRSKKILRTAHRRQFQTRDHDDRMHDDLWKVEDSVRGKDPNARVAARQETSVAVVADLFELWQDALPRISGKSKLAEAIRYAISRRAPLERFLTDGRVEIDSNIVERAIRPQTITRKNSLFAGSDGGGRTWATIATLLQTAKMNDVDPLAWLTQTLERLANGWPNAEIDALMPWRYTA
ncbi:MAG: transposase [Methylovirgula sp.]